MPDKVIPPPIKATPLRTRDSRDSFDLGEQREMFKLNKEVSQYGGLNEYTDATYDGNPYMDVDRRFEMIQDAYDSKQPWYDKLGNGLVKFTGTFASGALSTIGSALYAAPAGIGLAMNGDGSSIWDNPLSRLGHDITDSINENFRNYQSIEEMDAPAWNPTYWASWNFVADNIIGNLGYAAEAYVTGFGISKLLTKMAPLVAGKALKQGLDIIKTGGPEALKNMSQAYNAVKNWDRFQQTLSVGLATSGEAAAEAFGSSKEYKTKLIAQAAEHFGGEDRIPQSTLDRIEKDAKDVGSVTYMINLPIIAGANMIQWGKSLTGFKSEFKEFSRNATKLNATELLGDYAAKADVVKKGVANSMLKFSKVTGKALKSNFAEAGQEGLQFLGAETSKNWYQRKHDIEGKNATWDYMDPFLDAAEELFTSKEGVANLIGGFSGGAVFGIKDYVKAFSGDKDAKALTEKQLTALNKVFPEGSLKQNLKVYIQNMSRHASSQKQLDESLMNGDEHGARNAKLDQLKSYVDSRIQTGRMDLLEDEMNQLNKLSNEDFKALFGLENDEDVDKGRVITRFKETAKEMHDTYKMMDRLFTPDMYRLNKLSEEEKKEKLSDLHEYKSMLWSYMIDFRDRDKRAKVLDAEITKGLGDAVSVNELMSDKFKSDELNDLYRQYVAISVESELSRKAHMQSPMVNGKPSEGTLYDNSEAVKQMDAIKANIRKRMDEISGGNLAGALSMEATQGMDKKDFIEEYMFNIKKLMYNVTNNPVSDIAMNQADLYDVIRKTHDLADLHSERRAAVYSYNQLAAAVKSGDFMSRTVSNPDYVEDKHKNIEEYIIDPKTKQPIPNPEYVPDRIPSKDMLNYDGYKKSENVRKDYYTGLRAKEEKNREDEGTFNAELDAMTDVNKTEKSKLFHDMVAEFTHGGQNVKKGYRTMPQDDLVRASQFFARHIESLNGRGVFSTQRESDRENFDTQAYIRVSAQQKAINDEINFRRKVREQAINSKALKVVEYVNLNKLPLSVLVSGFTMGDVVVSDEIIDRAAAIIKERNAKAAEVAEAARLAKLEAERAAAEAALLKNKKIIVPSGDTENNTIITDEVWKEFSETGVITEALGRVVPELADKIEKGEEFTGREEAVYKKYEKQIQKKLAARKATLTAPKFRKKPGIAVQPEPAMPMEYSQFLEDAQSGVLKSEEEIIKYDGSAEGFLKLRRSDVEFDRLQKENVYDANNNVIANNFQDIGLFGDHRSLTNFHKKPLLRFRLGDGVTAQGEPNIHIDVSPDGGKTWKFTPYFVQGKYDFDGKLSDPQFYKDPAANKVRQEAYFKAIDDIQAKVKADKTVTAEIKGTPTFGKLIQNKLNDEGVRESRGIIESLGSVPLNNPADPFSVVIATVYSGDPVRTQLGVTDFEQAGTILMVNEIPDLHVPQALANGIGKKGAMRLNGSRIEGQMVALVPTGKVNEDGLQIRYPVMLSGARLDKHTSDAYSFGSGNNRGTSSNMGEVLVDALLNPFKPEHQPLFTKMFEAVGMTYDGIDKSDWSSFYTQANVERLINKIFFSKPETITSDYNYTLPFKFEVVKKDGSDAIAIRVAITDEGLVETQSKKSDIYIVNKDGKLMVPMNEDAKKDFVQYRIAEEQAFRKKEGLAQYGELTYEEIQSVIKQKAFRTPLDQLSAPPAKQKAFTGFVFDDNGILTMETYPTYFDYADKLGLVGVTVQAVKDKNGKPQYFINQEVYFAPKQEVKLEPVKKVRGTKKAKDGSTTVLGAGEKKPFVFENRSSPEAQAGTSKAAPKGGMPSSMRRGRTKPMLAEDVYSDVRQSGMNGTSAVEDAYNREVAEQVSNILLDHMLNHKKGKITIAKLKLILKDKLGQRRYDMVKSVRPELKDVTYNQWMNMTAENPLGNLLTEAEIEAMETPGNPLYDETKLNQYFIISNGLDWFDSADFKVDIKNGLVEQEDIDRLTVGQRTIGWDKKAKKPITEPLYFMGFGNMAVQRLLELNIVQAINDVTTTIQLNEDGPGYEARNDDGWALRIDPRTTLGMQAKILLQRVPDIDIAYDAENQPVLTHKSTITGFAKYMRPEIVSEALFNLGQKHNPLEFEYQLMENPAYGSSKPINALRVMLREQKQQDIELYNQMIKQLALTYTSLKKNGVQKMTITQQAGKSPTIKTLSGARTGIGAQLAELWQNQFLSLDARRNYILEGSEIDPTTGIAMRTFSINPVSEFATYDAEGNSTTVVGKFTDVFNKEIERILKDFTSGETGALTFQGYYQLGFTVKNILGLDLVEGDWAEGQSTQPGFQTAMVLKSLNEKVGNNKKPLLSQFIRKDEVKDLGTLFRRLISKNIAQQIESQIKKGAYDPELPFKESTKALDVLGKIFKTNHQNVTTDQAKNIHNENEYTNVQAEMFNAEIKALQYEDNILALSRLPIGQYHPFLSQQVRIDETTGTPVVSTNRTWENISSDMISGIEKSDAWGKATIDARKAGVGDLDLMSMLFYHDTEKGTTTDQISNRGIARYYIPFGDSSSANSLEFSKFSFAFEYNDNRLVIKPGDVRTNLFLLFKSEVNRVRDAFERFDEVNNDSTLTLEDKKFILDEGYGFIEENGVLRPGAGSKLYYWGAERNRPGNDVGGLFNIETINGKPVTIGLQEGLYDSESKQFDDEKLMASFDSFIDDYLTEIVNHKMKTFDSFKDKLFSTTARKSANHTKEAPKFNSPSFYSNVFGAGYMSKFKDMFGKSSKIDGQSIDSYYAKEWDNEADAAANGLHAQMLKGMIIEHQVNALVAITSMQQLTWDYAALDAKGDFKSFVDNMMKRYKAFASPSMATPSRSSVAVITYNDVKYSQMTVSRESVEPTFTKHQRSFIKFMERHEDLAKYVNQGTVPARFEELALIYATQAGRGRKEAEVVRIIRNTLKSDITDGGTIITLQEYLFQSHEQGRITTSQYKELLNYYSNPDIDFTSEDHKKLGFDMKFKGQKMVGAGAYIIPGQRKVPIYMKDAKIVLIPAQVKGTQFEAILRDLHSVQKKSENPAPGVQLAPKSALKTSNAKVIDLFDANGNVIASADPTHIGTDGRPATSIMGATMLYFPRAMYGEQVQNPDKHKNENTLSAQLMKNMLLNIPDNRVYARDRFYTENDGRTVFENVQKGLSREVTLQPQEGITKVQLVKDMMQLLRQMRSHKLQNFINKFGLDYNISEEWTAAFRESGFASEAEFDNHLNELARSKDKEKIDQAYHLKFVKYDLVIRTMQKMLHDIRQQALSRKGMDISQVKILDAIITESEGSDEFQRLKVPLTFAPGNKQYQQVILSEIQKLFASTKINGAGFIQASTVGHAAAAENGLNMKVQGSSTLKGYAPIYDKYNEDGTPDLEAGIVGFTPPEIMIPWIFKDASGKLLPYEKYVDKDGYPIPGMIDEDLLYSIGFRIPNTGMNMAGRFKIARFFSPEYKDTILIPDILYSQMGTDLDFDKLYNYLYNIKLGANGRIMKHEGVINMRQINAVDVLNTKEAKERAVDNLLIKEDPTYAGKRHIVEKAYYEYRKRLDELKTTGYEDQEETDDADPIFSSIGETMLKDLAAVRDRLAEETKGLKGEDVFTTKNVDIDGLITAGVVTVNTDPKNKKNRTYQYNGKSFANETALRLHFVALNETNEKVTYLQEQFKGLIAEHTALQQRRNDKLKDFDMLTFLTDGKTQNAHLLSQSYQQLENAYIETYHILMGDVTSLDMLLTPLTTEMISDEVNEPKFNDKSYVEVMEEQMAPPNSEAGLVANAGKMRQTGSMVGVMANASFAAALAQTARLSVGNMFGPKETVTPDMLIPPIVFLNDEGQVIAEDQNTDHFVSPINNVASNSYAGQVHHMTVFKADGTKVIVPHKLYRMVDLDGNYAPIEQINSFLQSFLDAQKDTSVIYTNVNLSTANSVVMLNLLGYKRHIVPMMQQEILEAYATAENQLDSPFLGRGSGYFADAIVRDHIIKAGLDVTIYNKMRELNPTDADLAPVLADFLKNAARGDAAFNHQKFFSVGEFNKMIEAKLGQNEKTQEYHANQLHVLDMFLRVARVGKQLFGLQQAFDLDSKGFRSQSIMGVQQQRNDIRNATEGTPNLIGANRLLPYDSKKPKGHVDHPALVAYTVMNQATEFLTYTPERNNLFADFLPFFEGARGMLAQITKKRTLPNLERFNINIIQYLLSNPKLYNTFLDVVPKEYRGSASGIRRFVLTDLSSEKGRGKKKTSIVSKSLAREINEMIDKPIEGSDMTYGEQYPILNFFKTKVQKNGSPSWVYNFATNSFKQNLGTDMPLNIVKMLADPNPAVGAIAKKLYLYYYFTSGITTPQSFGHLLAQEKLFEETEGSWANVLNKTLDDLNVQTEALNVEVADILDEEYTRPKWFKRFDDLHIKYNKEASRTMHGLFVQMAQNNPYDFVGKRAATVPFEEGTAFEEVPGEVNQYKILEPGTIPNEKFPEHPHHPPVFMDTHQNLYVINRDYYTYTRVPKAGGPLYTEYSFGDTASETLVYNNRIKSKEETDEIDRVVNEALANAAAINNTSNTTLGSGGSPIIGKPELEEDGSLAAIELDKPVSLDLLFNYIFDINRFNANDTIEKSIENNQMMQLAIALRPYIPANVSVTPYSKAGAKKKFSDDNEGRLTFVGEEGRRVPAYGLYHSGLPNGTMELAFEYADKLPGSKGRFLRQVFMHETGHAVTENVLRLLEEVKAKRMTKAQLMNALGVLDDEKRGQFANQMIKAHTKLSDLFEFMKKDPRLANAYADIMAANVSEDRKEEVRNNAKSRLRNTLLANMDEMVSYMFMEKGFRDALDRVQVGNTKKSIFQKIMDFITEMLGLTPGSMAHEAFGNIFEILDPLQYGTVPKSGWTKDALDGIVGPDAPMVAEADYIAQYEAARIAKVDALIANGEVTEFCTI